MGNLKSPGGGGDNPFLSVDLMNPQTEGRGIPTTKKWNAYSSGLNLIGKCSSKKCISAPHQVIHNVGYGLTTFTTLNNKISCPACSVGEFTPSNFLVSQGSAKFRFRKSKQIEVTIVLESFCPGMYKTLSENSNQTKYEFLEVETQYEGAFACMVCNSVKDEDVEVLQCGHTFHASCFQHECSICNADVNPNAQFYQIGHLQRSFKNTIENNTMKENWICRHMDKLVKQTIVNSGVLSKLFAKKLFSKDDLSKLVRICF